MRTTSKLFMVLAMLCGVACTTNTLEESVVENNAVSRELPNEINVSFDDATSRIQLDEQCRTTWTEDDEVSVFYFSDANNRFLFMGDTGDRNGALVVEDNRMSDATAEIDKVVLVYPYSDDYKLNATTKSIGITIPGTQYYLNGSYGVGANIMTSVGTTNDFALKSVCGWIKVQLTGAASVTEVTLTGNNKEQLAGDATLYYEENRLALLGEEGGPDDDSQVGGTLFFGEYVRTITLDCGEGIALDSTTPTEFYFVLAPQTFDEGITIKATLSDGTTITKSTSKSITIERNVITPMASFDVQPTNEIWYTSTDGDVVTPYRSGASYFGANIVSNTYENGKGVIKFDGDVTKIGNYAFSGCSSLTSITIPDSVTSIGNYAFDDCSSLAEFSGKFASEDGRCLVVDGVINSFAIGCGLTEYTIPEGVTSIGYGAFSGCSSLTSITIPDGVTSIGSDAFYNCSSLASITIPDSVTSIGEGAFALCSSLTSFTIPDGVTSIGVDAFAGCTSLTSITIPDSVTEIGSDAFYNCSSLASITIPDSVTSIGVDAFAACTSLTSITIPDSVTSIGDSAFEICTSLTSVYCKATTPPTAIPDSSSRWDAFDYNASGRKIYVPEESVEAYKNAEYWSDYADDIEGYEFLPANNEIWYTSTDGNIVEPHSEGVEIFGANIVSNTYENGKGVIKFDGDVTKVGKEMYNPLYEVLNFYDAPIIQKYRDNPEAFYSCATLSSITLPQSVSLVSQKAFMGCTNLTKFNGKYSAEEGKCLIVDDCLISVAPMSCSGKFSIPENVQEILTGCFCNCENLTELEFQNENVNIYYGAFVSCDNLTSVELPKGDEGSMQMPFRLCPSLKTVTLNEVEYAILYETSVENVIINEGITYISDWAFGYCDELTGITIPDDVSEIGRYAFAGSGIQNVTLPQGISSIKDGTFSGCSSLANVTIPDSVTSIGQWSFQSCHSLAKISIPESVTSIGEMAFQQCLSLTSAVIPEGITSLGVSIFGWCSNLAKFEGEFASEDGRCLVVDGVLNSFAPAGLTEYTIPEGITQIGDNAFATYDNLTSITIPESINYIGHNAFHSCDGLEVVYCTPTTPPVGSVDMFSTTNNNYITNLECIIYVPTESVDAYKNAEYWSEYADAIEPYVFE